MNVPTPVKPSSATHDDIERAVRIACARIAPVWPLERFVAVNPYFGLTDQRFEDAAARLACVVGAHSTLPTRFYLDAIEHGGITNPDLEFALEQQGAAHTDDVEAFLALVRDDSDDTDDTGAVGVPTVARVANVCAGKDWERLSIDRISAWAASYFDDGQAMWRSADESQSLFAAWKEEAGIDRTPEIMGLAGFRTVARSLPDDAFATIEDAIDELHVPAIALELYLHALLLRVGGWAAHAARLGFERQLHGRDDDTLMQLLAVVLAWEVGILRALARDGVAADWETAVEQLDRTADRPTVPASLARLLVLQNAFEHAEQRRIVKQLSAHSGEVSPAARRPRAQAVFCIDVRSEVFRRNLEAVSDDTDTIGFAGFFGFPITYVPIAHEVGEAQCPVLLTPAYTVFEALPDHAEQTEAVAARRFTHEVKRAWKSFKMGAISCFSFVGPVGLLYLPKLFTDTYGRTRPVHRPETEGLPNRAVATKAPNLSPAGPATAADSGIPLDARVQLAEGALRAMSLTDGFAPVVLIAGHGATTVNNPYGAGLDCGACGGHSGEANARVAAATLNDPDVHAALVGRGITIPDDTWFVAGLHDTTTDEVMLFDRELVPAAVATLLAWLEHQLVAAGRGARRERAERLGISQNDSVDTAVVRRSRDWSQVRPEWGLAGCRAFVIAPRHRTRDLDLEGRAFLHSYDWNHDDGFKVLELIMTAPMVVASWINLQYYASTVDNRVFGSGNKTLHNVVGRLGVLEGNAGDLRVGLPLQSVHDGTKFQHEPLRLNVIIEAPTDAVNDVLVAHPSVRDLCDNGWLHLLAMDDTGTVAHRYTGGLQWAAASKATQSSIEPASA